jgi:muramoyltetrapeptide carboxypeptidase
MATRIVICAPATPIRNDVSDRVNRLAAAYPDIELVFHDQCFLAEGHFAGDDETRLAVLVECANDASFDAVWLAKGGYGTNRIAEQAIAKFGEAARQKTFLGYSDAGYLLAGLYREGIGKPVHGPMPVDVRREGGDEAIGRVLKFFSGNPEGLEESIGSEPVAAFNLTTLSMLCGTKLMPDLAGHVVMIEEVSEYLYSIDRLFFHLTENLRGIAGLRLGRVTDVPENDRPFGAEPIEIAQDWCARSGIPFLGVAEIGHNAANRIVPFGLAGSRARP